MITKEQFQEALDYIAGTCMITPQQALETVIDRDASEQELEEFEAILINAEVFECDSCGWFTHSGEGDGTYCSSCLDDLAMEEDSE